MAIVRTVEWVLALSSDEAARRLVGALAANGMDASQDGGVIHARSRRSLVKNRWAAEVTVELAPLGEEATRATCRVDMLGTKHYAVLDDIAEAIGDDAFGDRGIDGAIERLGRLSRAFGRKEVRHLRHLIRADETVAALGQGTFNGKQGIVVLTDQRLFFFEKSLGSESLEEFGLTSISSIEVNKKLTGERLLIHASGNRAEIGSMMHGQAEQLAHAYRSLKSRAAESMSRTTTGPGPDVLDQIRKLGELRDAGLLTDDEFVTKKAALLDRL